MIRRSAGLVAVITAMFGVSVVFASDDPIKDRRDLMKGNGKAVKGVVAMLKGEKPYDGAVALGCVIRGETSHYDIVCNNANHWLMEVAIRNGVPLGNGILTVDTEAQALARAHGTSGKGGAAVRACLSLIELARTFAGQSA